MTRDDVVSLIAFRLGNRTDIDQQIVNELVLQQHQLELGPVLPWFLIVGYATTYTVPNEEAVAVPGDFLRETEEETALWLFEENPEEDGNWTPLKKSPFDIIKTRYPGFGVPTHYSLVGMCFRLRPTPREEHPLKMFYYAKDRELVTNIENKWLRYAPGVLLNKTGQVLAASLGNKPAMDLFAAELKASIEELNRLNVSRMEAGHVRQMGGADGY